MASPAKRGPADWLFVACGVWLIGLGCYFVFVRPALLPEDLRYVGADPEVLRLTLPRLTAWLGKVFTVMGGFMAGVGILVVFLGWNMLRLRLKGAALVLALTGALTVGLMSMVNFALHSDFRWLLVTPVVAWASALLLYVRRSATGA